MNPIEDKKFQAALVEFYTLYQSVVTGFGTKQVAGILKKSDKTVYAEMSLENLHKYLEAIQNYDEEGKPAYMPKLGFVDVMVTMCATGEFGPFISAARCLNLMCAPGPKQGEGSKEDFANNLQGFNKEYVEGVNEVLKSIADGTVDLKEAKKARKEMMDIANSAFHFVGIFDRIIEEKS